MKKLLGISLGVIFCMFAGGAFAQQQLLCNDVGMCAVPNTAAAIGVCNSYGGCKMVNESAPRSPVVLNGYVQNYGQNHTQVGYQLPPQPHLHYHGGPVVYSPKYQPRTFRSRPADRIIGVNNSFQGFSCNFHIGERLNQSWPGGGATCDS